MYKFSQLLGELYYRTNIQKSMVGSVVISMRILRRDLSPRLECLSEQLLALKKSLRKIKEKQNAKLYTKHMQKKAPTFII